MYGRCLNFSLGKLVYLCRFVVITEILLNVRNACILYLLYLYTYLVVDKFLLQYVGKYIRTYLLFQK
ncbi:hypothetical protein F4781DRAFT_402800 [Annulohypoxylon bovei var. microspora]|nr:hypothetical protein F4781DRAFT_402800 [Annulohypoxylon bovei var. microspora]